ncbi:hypothetical protein ABDK00_014170 [Niabella insulamsoli]|uniref:hypothetical protein n=1 Tax=Niabella insulamsoli TaxID=3144874 RepID=UPI0031FE353A
MLDGNLAMANQFENNEPDLLDYKGITVIQPDNELEYWRKRCLLAEEVIRASPCDPDITLAQLKAAKKYHEFLKENR